MRALVCASWLALAVLAAGCGAEGTGNAESGELAPVHVVTSRAVEQPVSRFITVTGTLTAEEQADVAAETAGRIAATPVERGTPVSLGAELVRIVATETEAQAREAEANAAQIQARLGQPEGEGFNIDRVPEVASARATADLAQRDFDRARTLFEGKLLSEAEFQQRRAQAENAQQQVEVARNGAEQQRQALTSARARVSLARKALADTVVRAPFTGVVAERFVSVGDYVTRGTRVASVMRVNPLRVELTVPSQYIAVVNVGRAVSLVVDAYPTETFAGRVRYISPGVQADSRAFVVEAVVPNDKGLLRPGLFVSARIEQASSSPGVLVPSAAVQIVAGISRVFVVVGDHVEERIVTTGQVAGPLVEATSGVKAGDVVVTGNLTQLADGTRVIAP